MYSVNENIHYRHRNNSVQQQFDKTRRNLHPQDRVYQRPNSDHQIALYKKACHLEPGADKAQDPAEQSVTALSELSHGHIAPSLSLSRLATIAQPQLLQPLFPPQLCYLLSPAGASVWIAGPPPFLGLLPTSFLVSQCPGSAAVSLLTLSFLATSAQPH